ncbi:MAG: hypothetical protein ACE5HI_15455 [bacterium]
MNNNTDKWLILRYLPASLFSLRMTHATSKGGKTLLVPTPYAFKMTLIDACFRVFDSEKAESRARQLFDLIKSNNMRFNPPPNCIVQNTFIKIRQEERDAPRGFYTSTIAYREFCFYNGGELKVAVETTGFTETGFDFLKLVGSHVNCIGKRGSFWQYIGNETHSGKLPHGYTCPKEDVRLTEDNFQWAQDLDDFGQVLCKTKDGFDRISTYGKGKIELGKHRILVKTLIPYQFKQSSRYFTQFIKTENAKNE